MLKPLRGKNDASIIMIQPAYAKYRQPLFDKFADNYNTTLYFVDATERHLQWLSEGKTKLISVKAPLRVRSKERLIDRLMFMLKRHIDLFSVLMSQNFSVIITSTIDRPQTIISLIASRIRGSRCILWNEEWFLPRSRCFKSWLKLLPQVVLRMMVLKNVDAVVVEGQPQYNFVRNFNVSVDRIFFANHCSLDHALFKSRNLRKKLGIDKYVVILYLGRIIRNKGLDVLIRAVSKIEKERRNVFLMICGDGNFRPLCEGLAKELELKNVSFSGLIFGEQMIASCYKSADIFVYPSHIGTPDTLYAEGWGLAINEAMSMGKPVVTTNQVGAAGDLVKNSVNGYVVKQGDVDDLSLALKRIIDDPVARKTMGRNSRKIFEDFNDFSKMFCGFQAAIEYVLERSASGRRSK